MRVAQLGVAINSTGAKEGGQAVRQELSGIATEANKAVTAVNRASQATTQQGTQAGRAATETARLVTGARELHVAQGALSTSATSAARAVGGEARVFAELFEQMRAGRAAAAELQTTVASTTRTLGGAATAGGGFAAALAPFGGPVGAGIIAALTVLPMIFDSIRERAEAAKRQAAQFREELEKMGPASLQAAIDTEKAFQDQLRSQQALTLGARRAREEALKASDARLQVLQQQQGSRTTAAGVTRGEDLAKFAREAANAEAALAAFNRSGVVARDAFLRAASAWDASKQSTLSLADALKQNNDAARQYLFAATMVVQTEANSKAAIDATADAQKGAAKATRDRERAEKEFADVSERVGEILRDLGMKADASLKQEAARARSIEEFIAQQKQKIATAREEYAAITAGAVALKQFQEVQAVKAAGDEAVAAALRIKNDLSKEELQLIRQRGEELARQGLVNSAAQNTSKGSTVPVVETTKWLEQLRDVVGVVQLIASAFGDVGRNVAQAATGAQSILGGLQSAGKLKNAAGEKIGLGTALSGQGGGAALLSGLGAAGQIAAGALQVADALDLFGNRARARARQMREDAIAFNRALEDFALVTRTSLEQSLRANISQVNTLIGQAAKATGVEVGGVDVKSVADLDGIIAQFAAVGTQSKFAEQAFGPFLGELQKLRAILVQNEAELRARNAAEIQRLTEDLAVRRFVAAGQTEAADAERLRLTQLREIADAEARYGADSPYLVHLRDVQAAETAAAQAAAQAAATRRAIEQQQQQVAFGLDLTQRRQTLSGDDRGAFVTGQTIQTNAALGQAQQLLEAGTITAAMFDELRVLLGDEMVQALKDFDEAVRVAKQAVLDDLAVRALVATGKAAEADALRVEIANRKELEGVTDEALRSQILYVQGLEQEARAKAKIEADAQKAAEQNRTIQRDIIEAYKILNPKKAAELEALDKEISRRERLQAVQDNATRAQLEQLFALQDAAEAHAKLTEELARQKKEAEDLANFTSSVEVDYLRATGRTFEADLKQLEEDRRDKLKLAEEMKAAQSVIDQINATFDAKTNALIAAQMSGAATGVAGPSLGAIDGGIRATTNFASVSDTTALRMLDVQLSQLTVLREIAAKGGAGGSGITVQITVTGSPLVAQTPQQLGRDLAAQLVPVLDEHLGRRLGVERTRTGSPLL